jgi:stearoyl-CoA desaturase (Delta-9 desaturase)
MQTLSAVQNPALPVQTSEAARRSQIAEPEDLGTDYVASIPFYLMHVALGLAFWTEVSWNLVGLAVASYFILMVGVTAGYHRYFAHRTFQTGRIFQFFLAWLAQSSIQKGVLWWAAHHRNHHRHSDTHEDIHSPTQKGFWWSHMNWILARTYNKTEFERIKDFARFPELRFLNRFHALPGIVLLLGLFGMGGLNALVWGGIVPLVAVWHGTFTINSLAHIFGTRRYETTDTSRNNFWLALLTCGEGWHNNHHFHQNTANQGWFWYEIDVTFYLLKTLSWMRVIKGLRVVSPSTKFAFKNYSEAQRRALAQSVWFQKNQGASESNPRALLDATS